MRSFSDEQRSGRTRMLKIQNILEIPSTKYLDIYSRNKPPEGSFRRGHNKEKGRSVRRWIFNIDLIMFLKLCGK